MSFAENIEDCLLQNFINGGNRTCFVCHEKLLDLWSIMMDLLMVTKF